MSTEVTELTEMDAEKVSGVHTPANGTPFLLLKAASTEDCPTCDGSGKVDGEECADCKGKGTVAKSDSAEADAIQEEVTDAKAQKEWDELDKALSSADRAKMPASSFAFVDKDGHKHLPVHDKGHVRAALGRFNQTDFSESEGDSDVARQKAAAKIKSAAEKHGIKVGPKSAVAEAASKSTGVPAESVAEPKIVGTFDSGKSSDLSVDGSMTSPKPAKPSADTDGGESTSEIPVEDKVNTNSAVKATAVASLSQAIDQIAAQREAVKDGSYLTAVGDAANAPGSGPWESFDSATLTQVAENLAACATAIDSIKQREQVEAVSGDPGDARHASDLSEAAQALEYALGVAARLSFVEGAGETVAKNLGINAINKVGSTDIEYTGDTFTMDVTKQELVDLIAEGSKEAVKAAFKQERKAAKNANNGGDISEADIKPTGEADADDVTAVPDGGKVDSEYVNKSVKEVTDQLATLTKGLSGVEELVTKIAKRPRTGGPILDGVRPAGEGRLSDEVSKGDGDEIQTLEKSLSEATDPAVKNELGLKITYQKLVQAHEQGKL